MTSSYRFSFGPWNIHEGADPFGPPGSALDRVRTKTSLVQKLGFDGVQFHDDDAVPSLEKLSPAAIVQEATQVKKILDDEGLVAEFVAPPSLGRSLRGIDGGFTAKTCRLPSLGYGASQAMCRYCQCPGYAADCPLAGAGGHVYPRVEERHRGLQAVGRCAERTSFRSTTLESPWPWNPNRTNRPTTRMYPPSATRGVAHRTIDPSRIGGLIETAHAVLAGLDPSDEMAFALAEGKLWSVHLNDQNGLKFDQDKSFGAAGISDRPTTRSGYWSWRAMRRRDNSSA